MWTTWQDLRYSARLLLKHPGFTLTAVGVLGVNAASLALVWISSPQYISLLWTEPLGRLMLAASAMWMFMGVMVMKKMINFDF